MPLITLLLRWPPRLTCKRPRSMSFSPVRQVAATYKTFNVFAHDGRDWHRTRHRLRPLCRRAERFKRKHPEVTVQLQVENTRRCCQAVTRGHVDIAIVGGEIPHDLAHLLQARRPRPWPFARACSAHHRSGAMLCRSDCIGPHALGSATYFRFTAADNVRRSGALPLGRFGGLLWARLYQIFSAACLLTS